MATMQMMRIPFEILLAPQIGAELLYSFIIVVCSLMVYQATKEMYELSSHKGLKYFRYAFLFFAVAYLFRYSLKFLLLFLNFRNILEFSPSYVSALSLFVFLYSSFIAVFYLLYSVMWKRWEKKTYKLYLFNAFAVLLAFIGTFSRSLLIHLIINLLLLAFVSFTLFAAYKDSKKKQKGAGLYIIYQLLFVFWTLNLIDLFIPSFFAFYQVLIYLISTLLFMIILYKVLKKSGG